MDEPNFDAPDPFPAAASGAAGGIVSGGSFGEDALAPSAATLLYLRQINPNLLVVGGFVVGGILALNALVVGLGRANPNNQMLETRQIEAEANKVTVTATTDALKAAVNQRPACIAIVCNFPAPAQSLAPLPAQPVLPQPLPPESPGYYQAVAASATTVQIDATMPEFWRYQQQQHPDWVEQQITACRAQGGFDAGWQSPQCQALSQALSP